jgi:hypothetical protein
VRTFVRKRLFRIDYCGNCAGDDDTFDPSPLCLAENIHTAFHGTLHESINPYFVRQNFHPNTHLQDEFRFGPVGKRGGTVDDGINAFEGFGELIRCDIGYSDSFKLSLVFCIAQLELVRFGSTGCSGVVESLSRHAAQGGNNTGDLRPNTIPLLQ